MLKQLTSVPKIKTIEDRNKWTVRMADNYRIPRYNWTIDEITGDITVNAFGPTLPSSVNLWHSTTCDSLRRDFRYYSISTCQPHACKCHSKMSWNGIPLWFSVAKEKEQGKKVFKSYCLPMLTLFLRATESVLRRRRRALLSCQLPPLRAEGS